MPVRRARFAPDVVCAGQGAGAASSCTGRPCADQVAAYADWDRGWLAAGGSQRRLYLLVKGCLSLTCG